MGEQRTAKDGGDEGGAELEWDFWFHGFIKQLEFWDDRWRVD